MTDKDYMLRDTRVINMKRSLYIDGLNQEKIATGKVDVNGGDIVQVGKRRFVKTKGQ